MKANNFKTFLVFTMYKIYKGLQFNNETKRNQTTIWWYLQMTTMRNVLSRFRSFSRSHKVTDKYTFRAIKLLICIQYCLSDIFGEWMSPVLGSSVSWIYLNLNTLSTWEPSKLSYFFVNSDVLHWYICIAHKNIYFISLPHSINNPSTARLLATYSIYIN